MSKIPKEGVQLENGGRITPTEKELKEQADAEKKGYLTPEEIASRVKAEKSHEELIEAARELETKEKRQRAALLKQAMDMEDFKERKKSA